MSDLQRVGAIFGGAGTPVPFTANISGAQRVTDAHGRFTDAALAGRLFSGGMTLTAINNATYTSATTGATMTPIAGIYNPITSTVNCVILQAVLSLTVTAATATGGGPFVWMVNTGQSAISTGASPYNRRSLVATGAFAKNMANAALTGMTGALVIIGAAGVGGGSGDGYSFVATAAGAQMPHSASVENIDGGIVVPPGGVLVLAATTTPVAHSAASNLVWEELPIY